MRSRVLSARAVRAGLPFALASAALGLLLPALPARGQGTTTYYSITDLGPGDAHRIRGLYPGYVVGGLDLVALCPEASGPRFGFLWTGRSRALCPASGDDAAEAFDFELTGYDSIVGRALGAGGLFRPAKWEEQSDGSFQFRAVKLPSGGTGGVAWGTESSGQVAGEVMVGGQRRGAYWLISSFNPWLFPLPGDSAAYAIGGTTTDPVTVGEHDGRFAVWYPRRSQNSVVHPLGDTASRPFALRGNAGSFTAVGWMDTPLGTSAFTWRSDGTLTELPGLGGHAAAAYDLNASGHVAGSAAEPVGVLRAVLWKGGPPIDLNNWTLPTCRDGDPILCEPWLLEEARSLNDQGMVVGSGTFTGERHAFLANPVAPLTWKVEACAAGDKPYCIPQVMASGDEPVIDPVEEAELVATSDTWALGIASPYAAESYSLIEEDGLRTPNSGAGFEAYAVFEPGSVIALLPAGETELPVVFHFAVEAGAGAGPPSSVGSADVSVALRHARSAGQYSSASGALDASSSGPLQPSGIFAGGSGGSVGVSLPVSLRPFVAGGLEVRLDASVGTSALASGPDTWGFGGISISFCAEDPDSITLPDGTPLAHLGVRYTMWPTVVGSGRCEAPPAPASPPPASCSPGATGAGCRADEVGDWCDGGCRICQEVVEDYACYLLNHPDCQPGASCSAQGEPCDRTCPPPRNLDLCPPGCALDTCGTCIRPGETLDFDADHLPDATEHDLAHLFFPAILVQAFDDDLEESYLFQNRAIPYTARPLTPTAGTLCDEAFECLEIRYGIAFFEDTGDLNGLIPGHPGDSEMYAVLLRRTGPWPAAGGDPGAWRMIRDFTAAHLGEVYLWLIKFDSSDFGIYGGCIPGEDDDCYSTEPLGGHTTIYASEGKHGLYHTDRACDRGALTADDCPCNRYDLREFKEELLQNVGNPGSPSADAWIQHPDECALYDVWGGEEFGDSSDYAGHFSLYLDWPSL